MSEVNKIVDWTDNEWTHFTRWLDNLLSKQTVELVFTKVDGSERVMQATKKNFVINEGVKRKQEKAKGTGGQVSSVIKRRPPELKDALLVWDVEVDDWRTVKVRNITNILTLLLKYDYNSDLTEIYF